VPEPVQRSRARGQPDGKEEHRHQAPQQPEQPTPQRALVDDGSKVHLLGALGNLLKCCQNQLAGHPALLPLPCHELQDIAQRVANLWIPLPDPQSQLLQRWCGHDPRPASQRRHDRPQQRSRSRRKPAVPEHGAEGAVSLEQHLQHDCAHKQPQNRYRRRRCALAQAHQQLRALNLQQPPPNLVVQLLRPAHGLPARVVPQTYDACAPV
jgi:hypothetical protein